MRGITCNGRRAARADRLAHAIIATLVLGYTNWQGGAQFWVGRPALAQSVPSIVTDKPDYFTHETVTVTGSGFVANTYYDVPVIRPDGSIVKGDGSFTPGWDKVLSNASGSFTYLYKLDGIAGTYQVRVYLWPWSGDRAETPVASTTFMDANIDFTQCQ